MDFEELPRQPSLFSGDSAVLAHGEMDNFVLIDEAGWKALFQYLRVLWVSKLASSDRNAVELCGSDHVARKT